MTRHPLFTLITASLLLIITSTYLTFRAVAYYQASRMPSSPTTITLILPDQEYMLTQAELYGTESELVIPTLDKTSPKATYNKSMGIIEARDFPQDYVIDLDYLRQELLSSDQPTTIYTPAYSLRNRNLESLASYNQQLGDIFQTPLTIKLKDGSGFAEIPISSSLLRSFLVPTTIELNIPPKINQEALLTYLDGQLTTQQKKYFNPATTTRNAQLAINQRFLGEVSAQIVLGVDDGPSSRGDLADRYLEIDLSQQKMYFFIGRKLYKEYNVSTGEDYPTPVGDFHILNKAPKAFSDIYNVWMPYWMGFKYASDVGAYLGIHEIAYSVDEFGKPFYRHGYYIGSTMTGGCIAMEPKDSKEIYDLSSVGMLIRVVP